MLGSAQVGLRFRSARLGWLGKESTYPLVQSFGSQHTAFDTLTWEDSETKSSTTRFHQNRLNRFYQPWARDSVRGLARGSARFDSGSLFGLTQGSFLGSIHERTRLDFAQCSSQFAQGPAQLESLLITGRGSGSVRLGSIRYLGLGSSRLVARAGLETRLGNREIGSMLDLAQLGARLRPSSGPSIGLSWGFARGSGLGIRLDLS